MSLWRGGVDICERANHAWIYCTLESSQGNQRHNKVDNLNLKAQPIASRFVRQPSAPSPGHSTAPWQHPSAGSPRSRSPPLPPPEEEEEEEEGQPRRRKRWRQQRRPESIARGDSGGQYTNDKFFGIFENRSLHLLTKKIKLFHTLLRLSKLGSRVDHNIPVLMTFKTKNISPKLPPL